MRDNLPKKCHQKACFIYNLDSKENQGTHWVSVFVNCNKGYYFDPIGAKPTIEIYDYMKHINNRFYNTFVIQSPQEFICGHYCLYVLLHLDLGFNFYDILNSLIKYSKTYNK